MSRTSKTNSAAAARRKRSASKDGAERTLLPNTGNVSVTINVVWPDGLRSASQESSSPIWKFIRYCLDKVWALFRP